MLSDCLAGVHADALEDSIEGTLAETFPPGGRKPRFDGWTPDIVAGFLRQLAAGGVVDHAARAVRRSAASAYAFRNRRQGRAFARMWDAVLVHRARARVAGELQGRAIAGCVSVRRKNGEIVSEYHYYDNRLAMSLLGRLDRLAEREAASDAHLRTLSEDLDEFIDCLETGGDADEFVEARKPVEPEPEPALEPARASDAAGEAEDPLPPDDDPELTRFAELTGCPHYRDVASADIEVRDLDPTLEEEWSPDKHVRAYRSRFMAWLDLLREEDPYFIAGPGAPLRFHVLRRTALAVAAAGGTVEGEAEDAALDTSDLDPAGIEEWTDDQLVRGWKSGLIESLADEFWDDLALGEGEAATDSEAEE